MKTLEGKVAVVTGAPACCSPISTAGFWPTFAVISKRHY